MGNLHISLFGKLRIHDDELGTLHLEPRRAAELLCYLLLYRDRLHEREKLATLLWPEAPAGHAKRYLRQTLWQLQSTLNHVAQPDSRLLYVDYERLGIWTFNNAPGLVYTCTVSADGLNGVMGYTTAPPNPGKGRFMAKRAASVVEASVDPLIGPVEELETGANGYTLDHGLAKDLVIELNGHARELTVRKRSTEPQLM